MLSCTKVVVMSAQWQYFGTDTILFNFYIYFISIEYIRINQKRQNNVALILKLKDKCVTLTGNYHRDIVLKADAIFCQKRRQSCIPRALGYRVLLLRLEVRKFLHVPVTCNKTGKRWSQINELRNSSLQTPRLFFCTLTR